MSTNPTTQQSKRIQEVFDLQKSHQYEVALTNSRERIKKLNSLLGALVKYRQEIRDALKKDFQKPEAEVDLTEIYTVTSEIKHAKKYLNRWMRPHRVETPLPLLGSNSWIQYEPKGTCLIISPWNFPVQLTFGPLVSAIAAGNTVMIKPSEHTPHISALMKKIIEELFEEKEVAIFEGAVETSTVLLALPFNHIFFTGSPGVGKIVMKAAAQNLTSVTLELGGKSPTIIDETANLEHAATRIVWGKFMNTGQICIAPDYVFIHENRKEEFMRRVREKIEEFYGTSIQETPDFPRIVNNNHFNRLKTYIDNSIKEGAKIEVGGKTDSSSNYIEPTVISDISMDSDLMQNEIFGPILPVVTFKSLDEPIEYIKFGEKPLALYIYSRKKKNIQYLIKNTRAGGTCINNNNVHFSNNNLPFGGSNNSGIGKSHGKFGFEAFSNARGIQKQNFIGALKFLRPPFTPWKQKLIDLTLRWF